MMTIPQKCFGQSNEEATQYKVDPVEPSVHFMKTRRPSNERRFGDVTPRSVVEDYRRFEGSCRLHIQAQRMIEANKRACCLHLARLVYCTVIKKEAARSSETSVNSYQATWRHIP
jgi:hypothetical protein